ncbi:hypothetical protein ACO0K9_10830 [Undibacterium sp. Ji50W]|uniref:hypothetical protein n=1 Tax=Undibacterium sp. Ji50W TaxID=3413041 RepID=UPI003BF12A3B
MAVISTQLIVIVQFFFGKYLYDVSTIIGIKHAFLRAGQSKKSPPEQSKAKEVKRIMAAVKGE